MRIDMLRDNNVVYLVIVWSLHLTPNKGVI